MRTIFIISEAKFPRSGAVSNYIQYLSCSFANAGYPVKLYVPKSNERYDYLDSQKFFKQGQISVFEYPKKKSCKGFLKKVVSVSEYSDILLDFMFTQNVMKDDVIVYYGHARYFLNAIKRLRRKTGCKIIGCPTEHFTYADLDGRGKFLDYINYQLYYNRDMPQMNVCFSISTALKDYINKHGGNSVVLPIMADTEEYTYEKKHFDGKYHIVFPANGKMKDSLDTMLQAMSELASFYAEKAVFHVCGVKKEQIYSNITSEQKENLDKIMIVHPWMAYGELAELYQKMHYLFIARPINQMTLSNFPSKVPECLCYGIVPIVSRVGDYTKYYLEDEVDSFIFDGCSKENCIQILEKALDTPYETYIAMSKQARQCAEKKFDYHNWSAFLKNIVDRL